VWKDVPYSMRRDSKYYRNSKVQIPEEVIVQGDNSASEEHKTQEGTTQEQRLNTQSERTLTWKNRDDTGNLSCEEDEEDSLSQHEFQQLCEDNGDDSAEYRATNWQVV
jgi:hypothetical protein